MNAAFESPGPLPLSLPRFVGLRSQIVLKNLPICLLLLALALPPNAEIKVTIDHNDNGSASSSFKFKKVPFPSREDAAAGKQFRIVEGDRDQNGGEVEKLTDGKVPQDQDE